jgi:hypothetical protein
MTVRATTGNRMKIRAASLRSHRVTQANVRFVPALLVNLIVVPAARAGKHLIAPMIGMRAPRGVAMMIVRNVRLEPGGALAVRVSLKVAKAVLSEKPLAAAIVSGVRVKGGMVECPLGANTVAADVTEVLAIVRRDRVLAGRTTPCSETLSVASVVIRGNAPAASIAPALEMNGAVAAAAFVVGQGESRVMDVLTKIVTSADPSTRGVVSITARTKGMPVAKGCKPAPEFFNRRRRVD